MLKDYKRLGEILVERGLISQAQLQNILSEQKKDSQFLGDILMAKNLISREDLINALSEQFQIPVIDLKTAYIDMELAGRFPSLLLGSKCFPLRENENKITFAIVDPLDAAIISKIQEGIKPSEAEFVLTDEEGLKQVVQDYRRYVAVNIGRLLGKDKNREL